MVKEIPFKARAGWVPLFTCLAAIIASPLLFLTAVGNQSLLLVFTAGLLILGGSVSLFGLMAVAPNQTRVLLLFGEYRGSVKDSGFFWVNPFFSKKKVSLRVRNFETGSAVVQEQKDAAGRVTQKKSRSAGKHSKVTIAMATPSTSRRSSSGASSRRQRRFWWWTTTEDYVAIQSESALRNLASRHPYDSKDDEISLRGNTQDISEQLRQDIQEHLERAGVEVIEARISHLAYSAEIAAAMLQRQQAQAVVAARTKIVEGAVGMV